MCKHFDPFLVALEVGGHFSTQVSSTTYNWLVMTWSQYSRKVTIKNPNPQPPGVQPEDKL